MAIQPDGKIVLVGETSNYASFFGARSYSAIVVRLNQNGIYSDFENDGKTDFSVFRNGAWYWLNSTNNQFNGVQFGQNGDMPAPGDYDNDGKNDLAVFRSGGWYVLRSGDNSVAGAAFGAAGDTPVPAAYVP
jgi:hypothetical protein